jgi:hypothetical protein
MGRPNLFHFASSELSQDAFFCWLASCADPSVINPELRSVGRSFLDLLALKKDVTLPVLIESVSARRQVNKIDIVIEINHSIVFIIEDKAGTSEHSNQLRRYLDWAMEYYSGWQVLPIYIQTYLQASFQDVAEQGFGVVTRSELIQMIPGTCEDSVLNQFREHLVQLEAKYSAFVEGSEWDSYAWQGYLNRISQGIEHCGWSYVPNPSGGFYAAYWGWTVTEYGEMYLQVSEKQLSVRIQPSDGTSAETIRRLYALALEFKGWSVPLQSKPRRGRTLNLVTLDLDHRKFDADGKIDVELTLNGLLSSTEKFKHFVGSVMGS